MTVWGYFSDCGFDEKSNPFRAQSLNLAIEHDVAVSQVKQRRTGRGRRDRFEKIGRCCLFIFAITSGIARAETVFIEAETFQPSSPGWQPTSGEQRASRAQTLWGADGPGDAIATRTVTLSEAGAYRVWVRYLHVGAWRGPFALSISAAGNEIAKKGFDLEPAAGVTDWTYSWQSLKADLPAGEITLSLAKHEQKNCVGYVRRVDCLLLSTDEQLVPDHLPYGPQTFVRVTFGEDYDRPVYLHLFADHYRDPWYAHYSLGRDGMHKAVQPPATGLARSGEATPWCNLTPTVYQDSGAALNFSVRHDYYDRPARLRAKLEFGRATSAADQDVQVIKTFDVDASPNGVVIIAPPNLESAENIARLKRDREFAEEVGRQADAFDWPTHGRPPVKIPFLVTATLGVHGGQVDAQVSAREMKTLAYFGFNGAHERVLGGLWLTEGNSYCRPALDAMRKRAKDEAEQFRKAGRKLDDIAFCMLTDEPTGQPASFAANDEAYRDAFRAWLRKQGIMPANLLVESWDDVRPVVETERDRRPALHYYTQLFRTRALGDFMAVQRRMIEDAYGRSFPTLVNFSDGAVYHANFCGQGVDYFELLDADDQNAIWGEDWSNNASTYQCAAYNIDLMRAAARKRGQSIGHYLIAYAGRKPWDIKTKATAETARGVKAWMNFCYGPSWSSHEGGPAWRSSLWYARPELWRANAEITREIGAVEDWLLAARPAAAKVGILYNSSADIWTMPGNQAFGFDRMHTWLALTHAQVPVDVVPEREVATGRLDGYQVCYLSGPNLTRSAAATLRAWVEAGGTLWLSAGAAARDEFNRPLSEVEAMLPAVRGEVAEHEAYQNAGRFLSYLTARDTVTWGPEKLEVLSVKQPLAPREGSQVLATFADGKPAVIAGGVGRGRVLMAGFLPALSYIKPALAARLPLEQKIENEQRAAERLAAAKQAAAIGAATNADQPAATNAALAAGGGEDAAGASSLDAGQRELVDRSYNPWEYPAGIRERLLKPVRDAGVEPALTCDTPLIDAVALPCDQGTLVALANHTLRPLGQVKLELRCDRAITGVESVRRGAIQFEQPSPGHVRWSMPLDASDFVKVSAEAVAR